ncbi:hypothetical protein HEK54_007655 [Escherichia coli]|uniref:hypothetical protein n=1 Tax=Escherichia coli TaxID=562 RepID=UPI000BEA72BA|nr:hypothetical protein [Escherichia coli]MBB8430851.1 hypothetical protein [Escherichia coli]MBB8648598.1 hypothetical protein [Escherichia coli]MBS9154286.1 hypothetical protein [Escherichia coli]HEI2789573.1 hypothetical protein [Escherichia coli]
MKLMSLIEMDGFLKGKCIPRDLKVNETNAEYLVRKFGELESKLETALRECRSAGITIDNLEAKCAALAAENAGLNKFIAQSCYVFDGEQDELSDAYLCAIDGKMPQTPATDAFLAEIRAQGVEMMREHPSIKLCSLTHICDELAAQLRKGGSQ